MYMKKVIILVLVLVFLLSYLIVSFSFRDCHASLGFKEGVTEEEIKDSLRFYKIIARVDINAKYQMADVYAPRLLFPIVYYSLKLQNIFDKDLVNVDTSVFIDVLRTDR